jgi:DNA polymerase I
LLNGDASSFILPLPLSLPLQGKPPVPLVKDVYGSERRKAKTLNFSIAYGKTVHGLAKDWYFFYLYPPRLHGRVQLLLSYRGISKEEAQLTLDAWYADRPEVNIHNILHYILLFYTCYVLLYLLLPGKEMARRNKKAREKRETCSHDAGTVWRALSSFTCTWVVSSYFCISRYRNLPDAASIGALGAHSLRAAINTPIQVQRQGSYHAIVIQLSLPLPPLPPSHYLCVLCQGSAADVVMMAMVKLWKSSVLKALGWKLLLQIHDEVILEGPKETAQQVFGVIVVCVVLVPAYIKVVGQS